VADFGSCAGISRSSRLRPTELQNYNMPQSLFLPGKTAVFAIGGHVSETSDETDPPEAYKVSP
jgi:hypothetical protein